MSIALDEKLTQNIKWVRKVVHHERLVKDQPAFFKP